MDGMEAIIIGDHDLYTRIHMFFQAELPEKLDLLELYDNPSFPLDKLYSTQTALDKALMERAWLKTGGYLIIQPTEALTVIDVNSGKNTSKSDSEDGAMKVNLEAAREAARQIRLRNLSGIILAWTRKRIPEFGLRRAYGATSRRILGQVMIENLLLTFMGGLIGFLFSYVALWLLRDWLLVTSLGQERLSIGMVNSVVFAAVFLLCLVMNLLSALLPAWKATHGTISDALNGR